MRPSSVVQATGVGPPSATYLGVEIAPRNIPDYLVAKEIGKIGEGVV
jgi:hypothetical protein